MKKRTKVIRYNKLVRDRIPDIIRKNGQEPTTRILSTQKLARALKNKIIEESIELGKARSKKDIIEELADIEECIEALRHAEGIPSFAVDRVRREKNRKRGGFSKRIFLVSTK